MSYLYDNYKERFMDSSMTRVESVPGVFAEYTYTHDEDFTLVAGVRADQHQLYGMQVTPRLHLRYQPFPKTTLRFSGGMRGSAGESHVPSIIWIDSFGSERVSMAQISASRSETSMSSSVTMIYLDA